VVDFCRRLWDDESGQDLVEYVILMSLIAIVVIAALVLFGPAIGDAFNGVSSKMP